MTDETTLLEQFSAGSHDAFRELFMRYHLKVYHFVLGLVKSEGDAEDLTQEIFLKVWTHRARFAQVRAFGSYLYVLAKHTTLNHIESKRLLPDNRETRAEEEPPCGKTPHDELVAKDLRLLVDLVVEGMPSQRRTIYRMSREEGIPNGEIAERLQLSKKTVENHLNLALKELRGAVLLFLVVTMC